jgi:hypothetical protein
MWLRTRMRAPLSRSWPRSAFETWGPLQADQATESHLQVTLLAFRCEAAHLNYAIAFKWRAAVFTDLE